MAFDRSKYLVDAARAPKPAEAEDLKLPSGVSVKVVKPDMADWILRGRLPSGLTVAAWKRFTEQGSKNPNNWKSEHVLALATFRQDAIAAALVDPRIVPNDAELQPDEIYYGDLSAEDAEAIFGFAMRRPEVRALEGFRADGPVPAAGEGGGEVRAVAAQPAPDPGDGGSRPRG